MRVMTVLGTRPEIIRLSRVIPRLDRHTDHTLVHTGQNWDPKLSEVFFRDLDLREPDVHLDLDTSSLGTVLGGVLSGIEPVLRDVRPDAFLVLGDTNSAIAAVMARRMGIPVFHMEAGNRCFDPNVPEEVNRRMIDHVADFNLCYTEHARRNLLGEGLQPRRTFVTGSPLGEVLTTYQSKIQASTVLQEHKLEPQSYFLVSLHREENVDDPATLSNLVEVLEVLQKQWDLRMLLSTHPRLRDRLAQTGIDLRRSRLEFCEPFGFLDYNKLQENARCVISDSGTISEEAAMLGFPAVTLRNAIERPEALDAGSMILPGTTSGGLSTAVRIAIEEWEAGERPSIPWEYQVTDCSTRVVRLIAGLSQVHHQWVGG